MQKMLLFLISAHLYHSYQHFGWLNVPGPNHTTIAVPAWTK